jgi:glutamate carboxypeptidase
MMLKIEEFEGRKGEILALLKRLVEIESPSDDKAGVDRFADLVEAELHPLGGKVTRYRQPVRGDQLVAEWGSNEQKNGILIMSHMDTVHPIGTLAHMPLVERDGCLYGPGVEDMKAGIAMLLTVLRALRDKGAWPARPITALFTTDEEIGSDTSRDLIERLAGRSALVLCLEPAMPDGSLKTWRKGVGDFELISHGLAAHAGTDHRVGRNAIEELAHQILAIQKMTDYEKGTTLNIGVVNGGTRPNVVPAEARALIDLRVIEPGEAERVTQRLLSLEPVLEGTSLEVKGGLNRPPMPRDARMIQAFKKAQTIASGLGMRLTEGGTGGGSDANFVAPLGIPVLDGLGAVGDGAHSEREHIQISSLPERTALLAAILTEW